MTDDIAIKEVVTAYDVRLTAAQLSALCLFLDQMVPVNSNMGKAAPGEKRRAWDQDELRTICQIRNALFRIVHG